MEIKAGGEVFGGGIVARFEDIVSRFPDKEAIQYLDRTITYGELDLRSSKYAGALQSCGVRPNDRIFIDLPRSDEQVAILLATLKARAVYVPNNPDVDDCDTLAYAFGADWLIADAAPSKAESTLRHLSLEQLKSLSSSSPSVHISEEDDPNAPACILSTSGTTGKPKGICLPHRSHVNLVVGNSYCQFGTGTTMLYYSPLSFDAATVEIWGPLLNGGKLVVSGMSEFDPIVFKQEIEHFKVNTIWITSGVFSNLTRFAPDTFQSLEQVMTGGDTVSGSDAHEFKRRYPNTLLVNCWGPAENSTFSTALRMLTSDDASTPLSIGTAVSRAEVHLIAEDRSTITAPGQRGEIYVGGPGLFLGYVQDGVLQEKTTWVDSLQTFLFPTGDFGSYRPDGTLEFLGREDDQIKVAGKRVQLEEINAIVMATGLVDFCCAVASGEASSKGVVLFVVPKADGEGRSEAWREYHDIHYGPLQTGEADFSGWRDSRNGAPIPAELMTRWLADLVDRIALFESESILDIGCGSGLLLKHARFDFAYTGVDVSEKAISALRKHMAQKKKVEFVCGSASEYLKQNAVLHRFDTVVINSVVQYLGAKRSVRNLLAQVAESANPRALVIGDVTVDGLRSSEQDRCDHKKEIAVNAAMYELAFTVKELASMLAPIFPDYARVISPKLCAAAHYEFGRRVDVLMQRHVAGRLAPTSIVVDRDDLRSVEFSPQESYVITYPSYDSYVQNAPDLEELRSHLQTLGLSVLPFFTNMQTETVRVAISRSPLDVAVNLQSTHEHLSPVYEEPAVAARIKDAVRKKIPQGVPLLSVQLLHTVPTTPRGKVDRARLSLEAKGSSIKTKTNVLHQLFGIGEEEIDSNLYGSGVTSMQAVRASLHIKNMFDCEISPAELYEFGSFRELLQQLSDVTHANAGRNERRSI